MNGPTFAVGDWVIYRPHPGAPAEDGEVIEIRGDGLVLVRYSGDRTAKATYAADLQHGRAASWSAPTPCCASGSCEVCKR